MRLSIFVIAAFVQTSNVNYLLSNFYLDTSDNSAFYKYFTDCVDGAELMIELFPRVDTANYYIDQRTLIDYQSSSLNNITIQNGTNAQVQVNFNVPPSDSVTLSASLMFTCRGTRTIDYLVIRAEDTNNYDGTWPANITRSLTLIPQIRLTLYFNRICDDQSKLGLKCDQSCTPTYNEWFCYSCDLNGYQECCRNELINSQNCAWNNATNITTTTIGSPCEYIIEDKGKENLYFWLMIGFVILSGILILLLLFCLCMMIMTNNKKQRQSVAPVYVQPVRRDDVIQSRPSQRRSRSRETAPPYQSYRNTSPRRQYRDEPRGSYQMDYDIDDDSLRNEWVEPMPRRVAKPTPEMRRKRPAREPRDVI